MNKQIEQDIISSYGSLDRPNWSFLERRFNAAPYAKFVERLRQIATVEEDTDLNDDCSVGVFAKTAEDALTVRLSLVGRYACAHNEKGYFLSIEDLRSSSLGEKIQSLLEEEKLLFLAPEALRSQIVFGNEANTLYAVLFSTDELIF